MPYSETWCWMFEVSRFALKTQNHISNTSWHPEKLETSNTLCILSRYGCVGNICWSFFREKKRRWPCSKHTVYKQRGAILNTLFTKEDSPFLTVMSTITRWLDFRRDETKHKMTNFDDRESNQRQDGPILTAMNRITSGLILNFMNVITRWPHSHRDETNDKMALFLPK